MDDSRIGSQKDRNWNKIKLDLGSAVSEWNLLCETTSGPSQDEIQLQEMKNLIQKLSNKIEEFSK